MHRILQSSDSLNAWVCRSVYLTAPALAAIVIVAITLSAA